jgi:lysophospholipase L1-like esterase
MRVAQYHDGTTLNACVNGGCGLGVAATWTAPSWTSYRLGGGADGGGAFNGLIGQVQLDPSAGRCDRTLNGATINPPTYSAIGDSITCCGTATSLNWPRRLRDLWAGSKVIANNAVGGMTTATMLSAQWTGITKSRGYEGVFILGGINDIIGLVAEATIISNLTQMYDEARAEGLAVHPITILPASGAAGWTAGMQTKLENVNAAILAYCATHSLTCIDAYNSGLRSGTALAAAYNSGDGLHVNVAGSNFLGDLIFASVP